MFTQEEREQNVNQELRLRIEKAVENKGYRMFQTSTELELIERMIEKKDNPGIDAFLTLYAELKHALIGLAEDHGKALRLLKENGIEFDSVIKIEE